ncbi:glycosyl hydrolase family 28-related protein [Paraburkholderia atlantica]|uniref:right-handed parallel beta-helix repeat-containing protein n=1 Tax=Paraburkholderia atlantica TaxID=2654982 RepID=UPI003D20D154
MTISSTTRKAGPFAGNGVTTSFPFAFKVFKNSDLQIVFTNASGVETLLTLDSDYSITLNADQNNNPGGTVTYPRSGSPLPVLIEGTFLTAVGGLINTQPTDITNSGGFYPSTLEDAHDRSTIQIQQLAEQQSRTLQFPVSDVDPIVSSLPTAAGRANKGLGFDNSGNPTLIDLVIGSVLSPVVHSVGALRLVSRLLTTDVFVLGYYRAADGGGGPYTLDQADTTSADNGGTVIVAIDGGRWKLQSTTALSARQFGAKGDGVTDDTAAIQNLLNCGVGSWFIPEGNFCFTSLTIPAVQYFCLFGTGPTSRLIQKGSGIAFPTIAGASCFDSHGTIRDLGFDGTAGTGNTLDTTYCQTLNLERLFFNNVPVGKSSLKLDGNPGSSTYMHDVRVLGLRIYSATAGNAGLALGAFCSDTDVSDFIMEGRLVVSYGIYAVTGAQTTKFQNCHVYNAAVNVVHLEGSNGDFSFDNCTLDNANQDVFYANAASNLRLNNNFIEAIPLGYSGIVLNFSFNNNIVSTKFSTKSGTALSCVRETNGSTGNKVFVGQVDNIASYTKPFDLTGAGSYAKGFNSYNSFDTVYALAGCAQAPQAQNTQIDYGANGAGTIGNTAWCVPLKGAIVSAVVFVDNTPAAGQSFVFGLLKNGVTIGTLTLPSGSFGGNIPITAGQQSVSPGDQLSIRSNFSATSGAASPRYSLALLG